MPLCLVSCSDIRNTADGTSVTLGWNSTHTGGLISVTIEHASLNTSVNTPSAKQFTLLVNQVESLTEGQEILQALPTVDLHYVFQVSTENCNKEECPSQWPVIVVLILLILMILLLLLTVCLLIYVEVKKNRCKKGMYCFEKAVNFEQYYSHK